jgi:murein L,D-transpeptidase YcbB/YkuD
LPSAQNLSKGGDGRAIDGLRDKYKLQANLMPDAEKEQNWNELARVFVQRFQQIHGIPHDSLAGPHTFALLDALAATREKCSS